MIVNFIGNFTTGYVGEVADEVMLAREIEALGHTVRRVPRDIWKAWCDGDKPNADWVLPISSDLNIMAKWEGFNDKKYITELRLTTNAPVFYWVWDYMQYGDMPGWHLGLISASDLYLGNDVHNPLYRNFTNTYYFPFDVADGNLPIFHYPEEKKLYDTVFFGSHIPQGDRIAWLQEINKVTPVTIFSWNWEEWKKQGFIAYPAVYGVDFNKTVAESKVILGFSVEPHCYGYWSNRVGKVLTAGGFLLYQYAPGMELTLKDGVEYFSSISEAVSKIYVYVRSPAFRDQVAKRGNQIGQENFTAKARIGQLMILAERYIQERGCPWQI